jgi:integrase
MKKDPYKSKELFENWLISIEGKKKIDGINEVNSKLIISFIKDFRIGMNVSNKSKMRSGAIQTRFGTSYKSTGDYVKIFKTFWHWHQKVEKNENGIISDVTDDLDTRGEKPKFVYFIQNDFEKIIEKATYDLKPILALAFDSGARVTELINIKVSDFSEDFKELNIREEISKTFGRKIKLMICSEQIKDYVKKLDLGRDDYVCKKNPPAINKELRKLGKEILKSEQIKFKNLTLYDFRHSSACFWHLRYKSEMSLKWRFGWKKSDMIHYYTEFLGMKDTITEDDLYVDITKTELEKEVGSLRNELNLLKESVKKVLEIAEERRIWLGLKPKIN